MTKSSVHITYIKKKLVFIACEQDNFQEQSVVQQKKKQMTCSWWFFLQISEMSKFNFITNIQPILSTTGTVDSKTALQRL